MASTQANRENTKACVAPPVLRAVEALGVSGALIALACGVSVHTVYLWRHGRIPIAKRHHPALIELLRTSIDAAELALRDAREVLHELEKKHGAR